MKDGMNLRKPQRETSEAIDGIIAGSEVRMIVVKATPGSGKSLIPIIAGKLIPAGLADAICWITPRKTLQEQGERGFLDSKFRDMLGHRLMIRSSTNDNNPCRGTNGFATTYQAVAMDEKNILEKEFARKRYILVLDEFHHAEEGGTWAKALQPLVENAAFLVLMTGTMERGDSNPIAFIPYRSHGRMITPALDDDPRIKVISYTREDALKERAILPLQFFLHDGDVMWENDGEGYTGKLSRIMKDAGAAIWTAISTEYATELLESGLNHWSLYKKSHPRSKVLIVTADVAQATRVRDQIATRGYKSEIATSHDDRGARNAIRKFKSQACDVLVSVAMIYEGFDEPSATHLICLTRVRSVPWIEQMVARVVRLDHHAGPYESQMGYVFAPDDFLMKKIILRIQAEQIACAKAKTSETDQDKNGVELVDDAEKEKGEHNPFGITPLSSNLTDQREFLLGEAFSFESYQIPDPPKTQSEIEIELRETIEKHLRKYAFTNYYKMQRINSEIKASYQGKARRDMTVPELRDLLSYVRMTYPLERAAPGPEHETGISLRRGSGHRVPTKAIPWQQSSLFEECI